MSWWLKVRKRRALDRDLREEIAFHRAMRERDAERSDTDVPAFGNETQIREELRDMWSFVPIETAWRDACYGIRGLWRNPGFTIVAVLTLGIGIGATTAVFSVVDGILIKPLPYPNADRLVGVWQSGLDGAKPFNCSPSMYFTYREASQTFQDFGLAATGGASVTGLGEPEQARVLSTTYGTLQALGVQPVIGRLFTEADDTPDGTDPVPVIISYGYWQSHFGGDRSVLGRGITVDSTPRQIVGVMPAGFRFLNVEPELITTQRFRRDQVFLGNFYLQGVARLRPGVTLEQANADLGRVIEIWKHAWPLPSGRSGGVDNWVVKPALRPLKQDVVGDTGSALWVLMGTISMVLLIACANVANLLLARTRSRQQELAVRAALGASRRRIAAALLVESMLLSLIGGAVGVGLAYAGLRLLIRIGPQNLPRLNELGIDPPTLGFAFCASLLSGLLFSLLPVMKGAGARMATALRGIGRTSSQSRERHRASNVLVVAQMALALILLIGSGLMIRTFQTLRSVAPGFRNPESIQIFRIWLPWSQVHEPEQVNRTEVEIRDKLAAIPGVTAVAFSNTVPLDGRLSWDPVWAQDKVYGPGQAPPARTYRFVSPGFLAAMGTRLVAGRDISWAEFNDHTPVALVSENMARELWGTPAGALGKRVREGIKSPWREIVGVVEDVRNEGAQFKPASIVYWPAVTENFYGNPLYVQRPVAFAIRTNRAGTQSLLTEARAAVWQVNSNLPVFLVSTMKDLYDQSLAATSFTLVMLAIAGTMALLLGIVGIYGVVSYAVSQRTREMGIRLALGAEPGQLRRMFVGNALFLAGAGVAIGLAAAAGLTRLMKSLLYGVSTVDPVIYFAMPLILLAAALLASYLPARRASRIDPVEALRLE